MYIVQTKNIEFSIKLEFYLAATEPKMYNYEIKYFVMSKPIYLYNYLTNCLTVYLQSVNLSICKSVNLSLYIYV